jgi:hypothetical protein
MTTAKQTPFDFFYAQAGYGYQPDQETKEQGRRRCAQQLADAERHASDCGLWFHWEQDDTTNREWTDEGPEYFTWRCLCMDENGDSLSSLCGVDFGPDRDPWMDEYRRVVEAELALEAIANA